jgi:hypothetical protein
MWLEQSNSAISVFCRTPTAKFEEDFDEYRHRQITHSATAQKRDHSQMTSNAYGVTHHSETANLVRFSATHDITSLRLKTASIR